MVLFNLSLVDHADEIIAEFIKSNIQKAGKKGAVVGLSGGVDSSVVGILAKKALGEDHVMYLHLPDENSSKADLEDVESIVGEANLEIINISPIEKAYEEVFMKKSLSLLPLNNLNKGNIKSRIRMSILYTYASKMNYIVLGTGNKSELLTGYFTKYGDGGADMLPIGDLYKTQVRELARKINIKERIINKVPSAGLWPGQKDEDELGIDYELLDKILYGIEHLYSLYDIASSLGIDITIVNNVMDMVKKSWHKRNLPIILKLGARTIGVDWID